MKAVVAAFNQEKALVGAFSVITNLRMKLFQALLARARTDTGLKLQQINHGSLTQEEEVASWGGISEEQTILADNRHGAS